MHAAALGRACGRAACACMLCCWQAACTLGVRVCARGALSLVCVIALRSCVAGAQGGCGVGAGGIRRPEQVLAHDVCLQAAACDCLDCGCVRAWLAVEQGGIGALLVSNAVRGSQAAAARELVLVAGSPGAAACTLHTYIDREHSLYKKKNTDADGVGCEVGGCTAAFSCSRVRMSLACVLCVGADDRTLSVQLSSAPGTASHGCAPSPGQVQLCCRRLTAAAGTGMPQVTTQPAIATWTTVPTLPTQCRLLCTRSRQNSQPSTAASTPQGQPAPPCPRAHGSPKPFPDLICAALANSWPGGCWQQHAALEGASTARVQLA